MTREQAKSEIMQIYGALSPNKPKPIDPLVAKDCVEDAISRKAVLDAEYQTKTINNIEYVMLSEVQMKMRKLPSVTPKQKTGKEAGRK